MTNSCIAHHFQHYASLRPQEIRLLEALEQRPVPYPRNTKVWHEGSESTNFYIVRRGWAYSFRLLENGSRQVLDLFVPGDIIGLREYAYKQRLNGLHTVTDVELCAFPKNQLQAVFASSGLLGQLFFAVAARGQALLLERVINLGRRSARQKVAHLLVELSARMKRAPMLGEEIDLFPLSQALLADILGLSAVHINRTIRGLREDGLIDLRYQAIKLLDVDRLKEIAGFNPAYLQEDLGGLLPDDSGLDGKLPDSAPAEISLPK